MDAACIISLQYTNTLGVIFGVHGFLSFTYSKPLTPSAVSEKLMPTPWQEGYLEESKMIQEFSDNGFFLIDRYFSGLFSHHIQEQLEIN